MNVWSRGIVNLPGVELKASCSGLTVVGLFLSVANSFAQPDARPRFDVISVKPHPPGVRSGASIHPGSLSWRGFTVEFVMALAYHLQHFQIAGGPSWLQTDEFDFDASFDGEHSGAMGPDDQRRLMQAMQVLLEDRFQLKLRRESPTMPMYILTIAKTGIKIKEGENIADARNVVSPTTNRIARAKSPIADLVWAMESRLETYVEDRTGLTGLYSYAVEWTNDPEPAAGSDSSKTTPGALAAALRDQLGFVLSPAKGPVEILTILDAEKPTGN